MRIFFLLFFYTQIALAAKYQLFLGLGQSIGEAQMSTDAKHQMTKNTSSVNASGGYYYNQADLGSYTGNIKDISSVYAGVEITVDKWEIFTVRGYMHAEYSNNANFGSFNGDSHKENMQNCQNVPPKPDGTPIPNLTDICYRDGFYIATPDANGNFSLVPFNPNPNFSNNLAKDAFMLRYGVGVDLGVNFPFTALISSAAGVKMFPIKFGIYAGGGYEFVSYSVGTYDNNRYNNTTTTNINMGTNVPTGNPNNNNPCPTTGGMRPTSCILTTALNPNDKFYAAGGGWFARVGASLYISNNLRIDFGYKFTYTEVEASKWYQQESYFYQNPTTPPNYDEEYTRFAQQLFIQSYSSSFKGYYQFTINLLF